MRHDWPSYFALFIELSVSVEEFRAHRTVQKTCSLASWTEKYSYCELRSSVMMVKWVSE
jgi:hypothetical protein